MEKFINKNADSYEISVEKKTINYTKEEISTALHHWEQQVMTNISNRITPEDDVIIRNLVLSNTNILKNFEDDYPWLSKSDGNSKILADGYYISKKEDTIIFNPNFKIPKGLYHILFAIAEKINEKNIVILDSVAKEQISEELGIKVTFLRSRITKLKESNAIKILKYCEYIFNPLLIRHSNAKLNDLLKYYELKTYKKDIKKENNLI